MDERGSNPNTGADFSCHLHIRIGPGFQSASCPFFNLEVYRPENETVHLPSSNDEIKNLWSSPSTTHDFNAVFLNYEQQRSILDHFLALYDILKRPLQEGNLKTWCDVLLISCTTTS